MLIPIRYHYVKTVAEFGIGTMVHTLLIFKISDEKVIDRVESVSEESGNDFFRDGCRTRQHGGSGLKSTTGGCPHGTDEVEKGGSSLRFG